MMHGREKSDSAIVAGKPTNKAILTAAEPVERRAEAKGNASQQSTRRTQSRVSVSHALERIRQTLCRHTPEVGAVCPNWARTDLCGGRSVMSVYRDLRNVDANYPFERSHNSGDRDEFRRPNSGAETIRVRAATMEGAARDRATTLMYLPVCQEP